CDNGCDAAAGRAATTPGDQRARRGGACAIGRRFGSDAARGCEVLPAQPAAVPEQPRWRRRRTVGPARSTARADGDTGCRTRGTGSARGRGRRREGRLMNDARSRAVARGFTLIEMLITLALVGLLVMTSLPLYEVTARRLKESELREAL